MSCLLRNRNAGTRAKANACHGFHGWHGFVRRFLVSGFCFSLDSKADPSATLGDDTGDEGGCATQSKIQGRVPFTSLRFGRDDRSGFALRLKARADSSAALRNDNTAEGEDLHHQAQAGFKVGM
jgi:hypothetical protein